MGKGSASDEKKRTKQCSFVNVTSLACSVLARNMLLVLSHCSQFENSESLGKSSVRLRSQYPLKIANS